VNVIQINIDFFNKNKARCGC